MNKNISTDCEEVKLSTVISITHSSIIVSKEKDLLTVEALIKGKIGFLGFCRIELILDNQILKTFTVCFFRGKLKKIVEIPKMLTIDSNCFVKISLKGISTIEKVKIY